MNPNTPAFPNHPAIHSEFGAAYGQPGMTLRQYAAIQIAAGIYSNSLVDIGTAEAYATVAIKCADALLAELEKGAK